MRTIYKYSATNGESLPFGTVVRHVGIDPEGSPCIWAEVDPQDKPDGYTVQIYGTGHSLNPDAEFAGSFVEGPFVWHAHLIPTTPF